MAVQAGGFDYWQAGEQPPLAPLGVDSGGFDYWQAQEQPPFLSQAEEAGGFMTLQRGWWGP